MRRRIIRVVILNYNLGNSFFANLLFCKYLIKHLACVQRDLLDQPQSRLSLVLQPYSFFKTTHGKVKERPINLRYSPEYCMSSN